MSADNLTEEIRGSRSGDLEKPELQRNYVWQKSEASRFIDSILLGLPVPGIFLAKTREKKFLIVDGYQRIMTVYDYITGIYRTHRNIPESYTDILYSRNYL